MKFKFKIFAFTLLIFFSAYYLHAQTFGCTDPMASNYNPNATKNNGSCIYVDTSVAPYRSLNLDAKVIETSGLIKWNNHPENFQPMMCGIK